MKRLVRKADFNNEADYNANLYESGSLETGDLIFKDDLMNFIMENIDIQGESEFSEGARSRDPYQQDDPDEVSLSCEGKLDLSTIESTFGKLTEIDVELLESELKDSEVFKEFITIELNEIKDSNISNFKLEKLDIKVSSASIEFEAEAGEFELNF